MPHCAGYADQQYAGHADTAVLVLRVKWVLQAGILAAMALSLASRDQLKSFGAADVTEAVDAACDSTLALTSEGTVPSHGIRSRRRPLGHAAICASCSLLGYDFMVRAYGKQLQDDDCRVGVHASEPGLLSS